jgi:hypothetical protein
VRTGAFHFAWVLEGVVAGALESRRKGFLDTIATNYPGIKIVAFQDAQGKQGTSLSIAQNYPHRYARASWVDSRSWSGPPYAVSKKKYTEDFDEVKSLGGDGITTPSARTADQTEIALYWWESSPLIWNRVARVVSADAGLELWENARLLVLLNRALADDYIAMGDTKNHYNYWRPVTAIQPGDTDGNTDTTGDPLWTPLRQTPANQDYASGHSLEGGAAAEALKQFFGTDQINFQDCSVTLPAGSTFIVDTTDLVLNCGQTGCLTTGKLQLGQAEGKAIDPG